MAIKAKHKDVQFGVGDTVRVSQNITEGDKKRVQVFEGMVIAIRGSQENKSFVVRRIGSQQVGIEKIFPISASTLEKIEVVRKGTEGVRRGKLYYTRGIPKKEVEKIYRRASKFPTTSKTSKKAPKSKPKTRRKTSIKTAKRK